MRVPAGLLSGAAVTGLLVAGLTAAAPAASAAATVKTVTAAKAAAVPAGVRAPWAELANAATGADLWSRSSVSERPMGSVTKVMTAYVVIESGGLNRMITVPEGIVAYDKKWDASTAGLVPGEKLTALQLLYAMMLPSGCDAAYTLAVAYGPGFTAFVTKMNATARKLGLSKTHFSDPSGLPNPGQYTNYSTVRDLISLGRDAMKRAVFRQVVATRSYHLAAGAGHRAHTWKNLNQLLTSYSGAIGIKTGFTAAAGECLLFEARRGSTTLIGAVLHSAASESASDQAAPVRDATAMLNWGFSR
ncbi:MAG TPA: D-alanyl-D-alanine carboxypeptidase [Trebonia sp.]|nr:D-alanyl-D-alanine carboxypeptidase [Trebonia sp.]